ncbi:MAG: Gldg family protein, partial [Chitinophagales bacterium]
LNDLLVSVSDYYNPQFLVLPGMVNISSFYKCIIIPKPREQFSDKDKFKIDQYIMNGGRVIWLIEALNAELDSVMIKRSFVTMDYPLNLDDQLFRYGIRVNPDLLLDLRCNPVPLMVSLEGQRPDFKLFDCFYFPILTPAAGHAITKNIDAVKAEFAGTIDTIASQGIKKTILLRSSEKSRMVFTPWLVDFRDLRNRPNVADYNKKNLIAAVLLEGVFPSAFRNRVPEEMAQVLRDSLKQPFRDSSLPAKMIVISDGDVAASQFSSRGEPIPLGLYRYTGTYFGNKNFLMNSIDYLCGHSQLINTRSKTIKLRLLDNNRVELVKFQYQLINMVVPIVALFIFGLIFNFIRIRKYTS